MMNVTQCEGLSIHVDQLNDELNDHWTQTEEKKRKKKKEKKKKKKKKKVFFPYRKKKRKKITVIFSNPRYLTRYNFKKNN